MSRGVLGYIRSCVHRDGIHRAVVERQVLFEAHDFCSRNSPGPFQHVMSLALVHFGTGSGVVSYMNDLIFQTT